MKTNVWLGISRDEITWKHRCTLLDNIKRGVEDAG